MSGKETIRKIRVDDVLTDIYVHGDGGRKARILADEVKRLRACLTEIRDISAISEGVEFYKMLADKALGR